MRREGLFSTLNVLPVPQITYSRQSYFYYQGVFWFAFFGGRVGGGGLLAGWFFWGGGGGSLFSICGGGFFKPKCNSLVQLCTNLRKRFCYKLADEPHNWQYRRKTFVLKHVERKNWDLKKCWRSAVRGVLPQGIKISIHLPGAGTTWFHMSTARTPEAPCKGEFWEPTHPKSHPQVLMWKWFSEECLISHIIPSLFILPGVILLFDNQILFCYNIQVFPFFLHLCYCKLTLEFLKIGLTKF